MSSPTGHDDEIVSAIRKFVVAQEPAGSRQPHGYAHIRRRRHERRAVFVAAAALLIVPTAMLSASALNDSGPASSRDSIWSCQEPWVWNRAVEPDPHPFVTDPEDVYETSPTPEGAVGLVAGHAVSVLGTRNGANAAEVLVDVKRKDDGRPGTYTVVATGGEWVVSGGEGCGAIYGYESAGLCSNDLDVPDASTPDDEYIGQCDADYFPSPPE